MRRAILWAALFGFVFSLSCSALFFVFLRRYLARTPDDLVSQVEEKLNEGLEKVRRVQREAESEWADHYEKAKSMYQRLATRESRERKRLAGGSIDDYGAPVEKSPAEQRREAMQALVGKQ